MFCGISPYAAGHAKRMSNASAVTPGIKNMRPMYLKLWSNNNGRMASSNVCYPRDGWIYHINVSDHAISAKTILIGSIS
jgi:hypothetical protein